MKKSELKIRNKSIFIVFILMVFQPIKNDLQVKILEKVKKKTKTKNLKTSKKACEKQSKNIFKIIKFILYIVFITFIFQSKQYRHCNKITFKTLK